MSQLPAASSFSMAPDRAWPLTDGEKPVVRFLRHADLTADDRALWAALSACAGTSNIFAQDWFMDAALRHADDASGEPFLAVVSDRHGPWLGVMPLMAKARLGRWPVHIWHNWSATNQFLGTPLVAVQSASIFWEALCAALDRRAGREIMLHFEGFDADDPVSIALFELCRQERRGCHILQCHDRPAHRAGENSVRRGDAKIRSRLRSLSKRLEQEHGAVKIDILDPAQPCAPWIDAFLQMEASGWKGRRGSALGSNGATEALFRAVIQRGHANGSARLATLTVNGRTIAMSSWFETGIWGHGFKMAFDEEYRVYAPGQLLMCEIRDRIGSQRDISFDTCVPRDASHCHRLWQDNRRIVDGAVAIGPRWHRLHFDTLIKARAAYASVKACLRKSRHHFL